MSDVLITGGAGFIGTTLARRLLELGHRVVLADNLHRNALTDELLDEPNISFVQADVLDESVIGALCQDVDQIVHLAAIAGVGDSRAHPTRTMLVNFLGTRNVLEAARHNPRLTRVVEFSSSEVIGRRAPAVLESESVLVEPSGDPRWAYAVSKLAGEYLAHAYHHEFGLPTVSIRPFNIYGPGQVGESAMHIFIDQALAGEPIVVHNTGAQVRSWCYVDDLIDALGAALEAPAAIGQVFNIGNPHSVITVRDLAERIVRATGSSSTISLAPSGYADVDVRIPNVAKAAALLDWQPRVTLDDGIDATIGWYAQQQQR